MKKYLFGLFALALAIGFSAFTTSKVQTVKKVQPSVYWYFAESDGDIGALAFGTVQKEKDVVISEQDCDDSAVELCLVGHSQSNMQGLPISGNIDPSSDYRIKERQ